MMMGNCRQNAVDIRRVCLKQHKIMLPCGPAFSGMATLEGKPYRNEKLLSINTSGSPAAVTSLNPVTQESTVRSVVSPSCLLDLHRVALGLLFPHKNFAGGNYAQK
jgi:hypothetical protein